MNASVFRSSRRVAGGVAAAASLALLLACTGSGDGGAGDTNDFFNRGADVVTDPVPTMGNYVRIYQDVTTRDRVCIAIDARGVGGDPTDVFSAAFTLSFDDTLLQPVTPLTGSCLNIDNMMLPAQVDWMQSPGNVVVGLSRVGMASGVGCGRLITLCFDIVAEGSASLDFVGNLALLRTDGSTIPATFVGATVTTRR